MGKTFCWHSQLRELQCNRWKKVICFIMSVPAIQLVLFPHFTSYFLLKVFTFSIVNSILNVIHKSAFCSAFQIKIIPFLYLFPCYLCFSVSYRKSVFSSYHALSHLRNCFTLHIQFIRILDISIKSNLLWA